MAEQPAQAAHSLTMGVLTLSTGVCVRSGKLACALLKRLRKLSTRSTLPVSPSAASSCDIHTCMHTRAACVRENTREVWSSQSAPAIYI